MPNLALADLVIPYLLKGENLGANHAALSTIRVVSFETASDGFGTVIRGKAEINGSARIDVEGGRLVVDAQNTETAPPFDPQRRSPIFDIRETTIDFELFVPRQASDIIASAAGTLTAAGFTPAGNVFDFWDPNPNSSSGAPSDYPSSGFVFDFIINAPSIRPPFLHPAKMTDRGSLVPDPDFQEVAIRLPKLRFRLAHGNALNSQLSFKLVSAGVEGLDDPGDIDMAELVSMDPPYAFVGGPQDRVIGFGFRKAVLDLSANATPPAVVEKFGFGDDWSGLYLPEARIFIAPDGARDLAFEAGIEDLLIGFGDSAGVSGDFEVALINQGEGELALNARFFDAENKAYGIDRLSATTASVLLPERTRMVVDIQGGLPPYQCSLAVNGGQPQNGRLFEIDLSDEPETLLISVQDATGGAAKAATFSIEARKRTPQEVLGIPGEQPLPVEAAAIDPPASGTPRIVIARQTDRDVILTTDPQDANVMWSIVGGPPGETGPAVSFTVPVPAGANVTVKARLPEVPVPSELDFYFYLDEPESVSPANESSALGAYASVSENLWTTRANGRLRSDLREPGGEAALQRYRDVFQEHVPAFATLMVTGEASYDGRGTTSRRDYNYALARRRAIAVREGLKAIFKDKNFEFVIDPEPRNPAEHEDLFGWTENWKKHGAPAERDYWRATVTLPSDLGRPEQNGTATVTRPETSPPPVIPHRDPPPPDAPPPPSWFRSARIKMRLFKNTLVAGEIAVEIDFQTAAEERLRASGGTQESTPSKLRTLRNGAPLAPDNPADGITMLRVHCQSDQTSGRITTLLQIGADPADTDGLLAAGWLPGEQPNPGKDFWLTLLGSYISFWPLLVEMTSGNRGAIEDAVLDGAALAIPGVVAALPWFHVERVILFGGEYLQRERGGALEGYFLFDVEADWSAKISIFGFDLLEIENQHPLAVRYKAIGLRFGNREDDDNDQFVLRPVFDASRGYTIDVARGGSLRIAPPFDNILKIAAARLSRTNPLTFEVDFAVGVDLGVVTIDRARVRVYLDEPRPPELTAFGAGIDIPGAIAGRGYMELGQGDAPDTTKIGGQIDLTLRPLGLRVASAFEIADIMDGERKVTGVYIGLDVELPVGIPLGASGLGLYGFRGIFGMHYQRNDDFGSTAAAPSLRWLDAAQGKPHLLTNPNTSAVLWKPKADQWAFGIGALLGTLEGGVLMNLDGTLLVELPGPRVLIVMNARIISPPPALDGMGASGGILAAIEITRHHFLIGMIAEYAIENLIRIRIPVDASFDFVNVTNWHFYLGQRRDPIEVDVLGIVKGTGYFMVRGNGLEALPAKNLPAVSGFALGLGAAASMIFGDVDDGLYLRVGGGMDAIIGFDPFILAGHFQLNGELRLYVVSIGASARLDVKVIEKGGMQMQAEGEACGHIDTFFFEIEGCVHIKIGSVSGEPDLPKLVDKLSLKSRSPALVQGTGVDRPIDVSLGDGIEGDSAPSPGDPNLITVPIDSIPVLSMVMPPQADDLRFEGAPVLGRSGLSGAQNAHAPRGAEAYQYRVTGVTIERAGGGPVLLGEDAPATWWTLSNHAEKTPVAQLALFTYEPEPASKAIEKTEIRKQSISERWGWVCDQVAPPASVLWTFLYERLGSSPDGWNLAGVPWPDPPKSKRTEAPELDLGVTERWRSGSTRIDNLRGIVPTVVVGSLYSCNQDSLPTGKPLEGDVSRIGGGLGSGFTDGRDLAGTASRPAPLTGASPADGAKALRSNLSLLKHRSELTLASPRLAEKIERLSEVPAQIADPATVLDRLANGDAVSRSEVLEALFTVPTGDGGPRSGSCETKVLQAPMLDNGELIVIGDPSNRNLVAEALNRAGVTHGPLDNVVVLHTGAFTEATVLLFVHVSPLDAMRVVVRTLDEHGSELFRIHARAADALPGRSLPARWTDRSGPWAEDVAHVMGWAEDPRAGEAFAPVLLTVNGDELVDRIEIGVIPPAEGERETGSDLIPKYYLAAIEALRYAEFERYEWDEKEIEKERAVITRVLGPAGTNDALLAPDALYRITVNWSGKRKSDGAARTEAQSFWFRTDAQPPAKLDPWVLMSAPFDGQSCVFGAEPVRIVFNTHDVDRLFAAYNKELRIRITASSGHHPNSQPDALHPFPIRGELTPAGAGVLSPWEDALEEVIKETAPCIPIDVNRTRQTSVTVPIPLDPYTDYKLDVEMVDLGAPADASGPRLYRRSFSTGAYGKLVDFANHIQAAKILHRYAANRVMDNIRTRFGGRRPQGAELDDAFIQAGLEPMDPSPEPRAVVFWEQAGGDPPQPAALLLDVPEPLWRARPFPEKIVDNSGSSPAERWVMGERLWLQLEAASESAAIIAEDGIIRAPGDQRALIVVKPGSRGQQLRLDLVRPSVPEPYFASSEDRLAVIEIALTKAVWEE